MKINKMREKRKATKKLYKNRFLKEKPAKSKKQQHK